MLCGTNHDTLVLLYSTANNGKPLAEYYCAAPKTSRFSRPTQNKTPRHRRDTRDIASIRWRLHGHLVPLVVLDPLGRLLLLPHAHPRVRRHNVRPRHSLSQPSQPLRPPQKSVSTSHENIYVSAYSCRRQWIHERIGGLQKTRTRHRAQQSPTQNCCTVSKRNVTVILA